MDNLERINELVRQRNAVRAELAEVTNDLRVALVEELNAGRLSELGAHKLTGVARSVLRTWVGKT